MNTEEIKKEFEDLRARNYKLNMARGKPEKDQLKLSMPILDVLNSHTDSKSEEGIECANYGELTGLSEAKKMMAEILEVRPENIIIFGNSSLQAMYDAIARAMSFGFLGEKPWGQVDKRKWLCPVPGYDRHFFITELFGFEMINIPLNADGPDMNLVEKLVAEDETIKGIWCVPKYSNPSGFTYSDEVVKRLASMKTAAKDFRIFWDNAYVVHHLYDELQDNVLEILSECEKAGNPNRVLEFASTSKITFPGSGISCMAASEENIAEAQKKLSIQTIGYDKLNQLRHAVYFRELSKGEPPCFLKDGSAAEYLPGIKKQMKMQAEILRPKFDAVDEIFNKELAELKAAGKVSWNKPNGGYFISLMVPGYAKRVGELTKECGLILTTVGATYPYGNDPDNANIRIAPSFPSVEEVRLASHIICVAIKRAMTE